ncbi:uncharacterized protein LOC112350824 [Selaginella moellendorffii]|nr:uncharacterized protein LOC112350824 [Selaginella moellendorffii]|eukprot:XP_024543507.1 uncharacterized protein LOC112350824 [Selaginella moellendorffii]
MGSLQLSQGGKKFFSITHPFQKAQDSKAENICFVRQEALRCHISPAKTKFRPKSAIFASNRLSESTFPALMSLWMIFLWESWCRKGKVLLDQPVRKWSIVKSFQEMGLALTKQDFGQAVVLQELEHQQPLDSSVPYSLTRFRCWTLLTSRTSLRNSCFPFRNSVVGLLMSIFLPSCRIP